MRNSEAAYARSKAEGEAALFEARPDAVIIRPSLLFGAGDGFFNRFAALARLLPVLPLAGADTRFQPVFVGDVAEAIARGGRRQVPGGRVYELGGPEIRTLREIVEFVLRGRPSARAVILLASQGRSGGCRAASWAFSTSDPGPHAGRIRR